MYVTAQRFNWEELRSISFEDLDTTYTGIGDSMDHPIRIIKVVNTTDATVLISDDGETDKDVVPAGGFFLYDITLNKTERNVGFFLDEGKRIYAKYDGSAPTSGAVYLVVVYASAN
jgi:hypothetical protein